jgi:hypothetical protein
VHVVKSDERKRVVWFRHDLGSGRSSLREVGGEPPGLLFGSRIGADLLLAGLGTAWLVEGAASDGARVTSIEATWLGGRFFRTHEHPLAILRVSRAEPALEPLGVSLPAGTREVQSCFERCSPNGPWAVARCPGGIVAFAIDTGERVIFRCVLPETVRFTRTSRDGRYVLDHTGRWLLDFEEVRVAQLPPGRALLTVSRLPQTRVRGFTMRNQIQAIGLGARGELVLSDPARKLLAFRLRGANGTGMIELVPLGEGEAARLVPFERAELGDARITRTATSPRGDRAFLDRRGLLHLVPAGRAEPEITVLLTVDRPTAIWCADGRVQGPAVFTDGDRPRTEGETMLALLQSFAEGFA